MSSNHSYPDWVKKFRTRGTVIKKKDNSFYLYHRTSKRVPGKKYPQAVDTYIGVITKDGVVKAKEKLIPADSQCIVQEYGFSSALMRACPEGWKKAAGTQWQDILKIIIMNDSEGSYLKSEKNLPSKDHYRVAWNAQYAALLRRIRKDFNVERAELNQLKFIYLVTIGKRRYLSIINKEQQAILGKLHIDSLEVR